MRAEKPLWSTRLVFLHVGVYRRGVLGAVSASRLKMTGDNSQGYVPLKLGASMASGKGKARDRENLCLLTERHVMAVRRFFVRKTVFLQVYTHSTVAGEWPLLPIL